MKSKALASQPKIITRSSKKVKDDAGFVYLSDSVKNFEYSDWIRVRTGAMGMLLSFGKIHPDNEKNTVFREILVPLHVAHSLANILATQMSEMKEKGYIKIEVMEDEHDNK